MKAWVCPPPAAAAAAAAVTDTENTFQTEGEWRGEGLPEGAATPPSSQSKPLLLEVMSSAF